MGTTVTRPNMVSSTGTEKGPSKIGPVDIKIAGASYHQDAVKASAIRDKVRLDPDPSNVHDPHAILLINTRLESVSGDGWLGYVPQKYSQAFSKAIGSGHRFDVTISRISGTSIMGVTIGLQVASRVGSSSVCS